MALPFQMVISGILNGAGAVIGFWYFRGEGGYMKKASLLLGFFFLILTFAGGGYILLHHGQVNAGYAVIPALWTIICFGYYRREKRD